MVGWWAARYLSEQKRETLFCSCRHVGLDQSFHGQNVWLIIEFSIIMTGWGMSAHEQALMISSKVIHLLLQYDVHDELTFAIRFTDCSDMLSSLPAFSVSSKSASSSTTNPHLTVQSGSFSIYRLM